MKTLKLSVLLLTATMTLLLLITPINIAYAWVPSLPATPVTLTVDDPVASPDNWPRYVDLSDVPAGCDVWNSPPSYIGWCAQLLTWISADTSYSAMLYSTPPGIDATTWNKINYLLNVNTGKDIDLQMAIWALLGYTEDNMESHGYTYSADAEAMVTDADNNGGSFVPSSGQIMGIYCMITAEPPEEDVQDIIIEIQVPQQYCYETAYGKLPTPYSSSTYAVDFIPTFSNWGWTNQLPEYGTYTFELWAGAGQCDTSKGTLVGTVTITYDASGLSWETNLKPGIILEEEHVYAGTNQWPQVKQGKKTVNTVAPGKYTINLPGTESPIWVIYHAVVGIPC